MSNSDDLIDAYAEAFVIAAKIAAAQGVVICDLMRLTMPPARRELSVVAEDGRRLDKPRRYR